MEFLAKSLSETEQFGKILGKRLLPGDLVLLFGDLGVGKTTLVQSIAYELGLPLHEYVTSPSFTLINEYQGRSSIYHVDLYRIDSFIELENLGLEDIIYTKDSITLIEWAEKLINSDTKSFHFGIESRIEIHIEIIIEKIRRIELKPFLPDKRFQLIYPLL